MTVQPHELPSGSQLVRFESLRIKMHLLVHFFSPTLSFPWYSLGQILGLNPPFGVKAVLANKFIDKALEFNPKLLILIVPPETQR